ncbi:CsxC family protein [Paenisporosarcina sp. OV554]|uniref:CsxC family protein n=1 Tax=Paenisporosarcina sp. OV554 TaxID=2135694 RepID=UPI000D353BC9|nr:Uracil permease [Paenisporosarcina sp. OV554]PUB15131.1 hypothetical protein C8K15_10446 [Paenisporosarcina sp. OV554]
MNQNNNTNSSDPIMMPCPVEGINQVPLHDEKAKPCVLRKDTQPVIKVPAVLAETTLSIVVEANIPLNPPAVEIKRVSKDVFLTQCKLVPCEFGKEVCPGVFTVKRAKLFVEGFIRKDIEYSTDDCNGVIRDRIATVPFSGFADLKGNDFLIYPILGGSSGSRSRFLDPKTGDSPRQDKYFFENSVFYNEQPYCELISANFFELDFSPHAVNAGNTFDTLREKIVLELKLKVLQTRQVRIQSLGDC